MNRQYSALSGIAILLVVLNHAIHFGLEVAPVDGPWRVVLLVLQALGGFAVPTFLFVSGAFLSYAARELSLAFLRSSLARILWPYVIWSTAFYGFTFLATGERLSMAALFRSLLVGYPYHFVPLLIFWYVAAPLVVRIARTRGALLLAGIGLYQALLLVLRYPRVFELHLPAALHLLVPPVLFRPMSDWGVYFPLGLILSMHATAVRPSLVRVRMLAFGASGILFVLGILNALEVVGAPWARFLAPVPVMFALPTIDRASLPWPRRLEFLGRRSYGIYLAHFVVISVVVLALTRADLAVARQPVLVYPALFVVALGLSVLLMDATARVRLARPCYRYLFGIVPPAA